MTRCHALVAGLLVTAQVSGTQVVLAQVGTVVLMKGTTVTANALPPLLTLPSGETLSASDVTLQAWNLGLQDEDVLLVSLPTGPALRYVDFPPLTICSLVDALRADLQLLDPATATFAAYEGDCTGLMDVLEEPGRVITSVSALGSGAPASLFLIGSTALAPTVPPTLTPTPTSATTPIADTTESPTVAATSSPVLPTSTVTAGPILMPTATLGATALSTRTVTPVPSPSPTPRGCTGDCHADGAVTIDEILTMVNIALGQAPVSSCPAGDLDTNGMVTVDELIKAVNNALSGCD